jgi:hypothetical protein
MDNTCNTSNAPNSTQRPFSGLYTCVPFMMTVCAGKFTPQAKVAVDTRTCQIRTITSIYSQDSTFHVYLPYCEVRNSNLTTAELNLLKHWPSTRTLLRTTKFEHYKWENITRRKTYFHKITVQISKAQQNVNMYERLNILIITHLCIIMNSFCLNRLSEQ